MAQKCYNLKQFKTIKKMEALEKLLKIKNDLQSKALKNNDLETFKKLSKLGDLVFEYGRERFNKAIEIYTK